MAQLEEHRLFRPVSCGTSQVQALPCTLFFISIIYPVFINVTCWASLLTTRSAVQLAVPVGLDAVQVYLPESSADTASRLHCALLCSHHVLTLSHSNSSFPFFTHWIDGDGTPTNTISLKTCFYYSMRQFFKWSLWLYLKNKIQQAWDEMSDEANTIDWNDNNNFSKTF